MFLMMYRIATIIGLCATMIVTSYTIQDEGNACFDMAASIQGLQKVAVSPGKSVWTSARSTWSGRRNLINADHNSSMILDVANLRNLSTSNEGLLSTLPSWCMFEGVECDSFTGSANFGSVQFIHLSDLDLRGTLPSSIGNFQIMSYLALISTNISGTIPSSIGALTSLQYILLYSNSLTGTIPTSIGALTSLQSIFFHSNSLNGTIPSTMSSLTRMSELVLRSNYLTMGTSKSVPMATFSSNTLQGKMSLENNCLVFNTASPYPDRNVIATHCRSKNTAQSSQASRQGLGIMNYILLCLLPLLFLSVQQFS